MKFSASALAVAAALVGSAQAHYRFPSLIVNDVVSPEYQYVRFHTNGNSPLPVGHPDLRCNLGAGSGGSTQTATVAAGSTVGFRSNPEIFHVGAILVYMSRAPGAVSNYDGSGQWFKIHELAPTFPNGQVSWPSEHKTTFNFKIPASLAPGEYLLRIEHIAVHSMPAQFFLSCAQVKVTGNGNQIPNTGFYLPSGYPLNHPGIEVDIYNPPLRSYTMPGPAVWSG